MASDSSSGEIKVSPQQVSLPSKSRVEANRETRPYTPPSNANSGPSLSFSLVGTKVGRYEIIDRCGQGGYGVVYRAHDSESGRDVAIKVLRDELCDAVAHR